MRTGDTMFNESFATTVERLGGERWLQQHAGAAAREEYARYDGRRADFRALTSRYRAELDALYRSAAGDVDKRRRKAGAVRGDAGRLRVLKRERWGGFSGLRRLVRSRQQCRRSACFRPTTSWCRRSSGCSSAEGGDFERFYGEVRRLAALPTTEDARRAALAR